MYQLHLSKISTQKRKIRKKGHIIKEVPGIRENVQADNKNIPNDMLMYNLNMKRGYIGQYTKVDSQSYRL